MATCALPSIRSAIAGKEMRWGAAVASCAATPKATRVINLTGSFIKSTKSRCLIQPIGHFSTMPEVRYRILSLLVRLVPFENIHLGHNQALCPRRIRDIARGRSCNFRYDGVTGYDEGTHDCNGLSAGCYQ